MPLPAVQRRIGAVVVIALPDEPDIRALLAAQDAADAEALEVAAEEPRDSAVALADTLAELSSCLIAAVSGEPWDALDFLLEASLAATDALVPGTAESKALDLLIDHARLVMRERAS